MNSAYISDSTLGVVIPHQTPSSLYGYGSYITSANSNISPPISTNLQIGKVAQLPLNQLENQPSQHNSIRLTIDPSHYHLGIPSKSIGENVDSNNYFHFSTANHPIGMITLMSYLKLFTILTFSSYKGTKHIILMCFILDVHDLSIQQCNGGYISPYTTPPPHSDNDDLNLTLKHN